ncbi:hypothetical protein TSMEX_009375, partial [Taenia solium]
LQVPYTLPCKHSFCLEPCLIARPSQNKVRCFHCDKLYPLSFAVRNVDLERRVKQRRVEERRSLVTTCIACQHPAPVLRDCQHCQKSICSSCWECHLAKVVGSVSKSTQTLLKTKKNLKKLRDSLMVASNLQVSQLKHFIEQATLELKAACKVSVDRSTANLNAHFAEHQDGLEASKKSAVKTRECIEKYVCRRQLIYEMPLNCLLHMRTKLSEASARTSHILGRLDTLKKKDNFQIDLKVASFLATLSLIDATDQEVNDRQISFQDKPLEDGDATCHASKCKQIFVGGIPPRTKCMLLRKYFSRYGVVKNCYVSPYKPHGFVTFESEESARMAISEPVQLICGVKVAVKEYCSNKGRPALKTQSYKKDLPSAYPPEAKKVFIGGISFKSTLVSVHSALSRFGPIEELDMKPQSGFAAVVFKELEAAELAISKHWYGIDGKRVEILPFVPDKEARDALARLASKPQLSRGTINKPSSEAPPSPTQKGREVFVGDITQTMTADTKSALSKLGPVEKVKVYPTRGFATVVFEDPKTAKLAILAHNQLIDNKVVVLRPSVPGYATNISTYQQKTPDSGASNASTVSSMLKGRKLIVRGLSEDATHRDLENYFSNYGAIEYVSITATKARVVFKDAESVNIVLNTQPHFINHTMVSLNKPDRKKASLLSPPSSSTNTADDENNLESSTSSSDEEEHSEESEKQNLQA